MSKREAIAAIGKLSSGTIAVLTGETTYKAIDHITLGWIDKINRAAENTFKHAENWMDVLDVLSIIQKGANA